MYMTFKLQIIDKYRFDRESLEYLEDLVSRPVTHATDALVRRAVDFIVMPITAAEINQVYFLDLYFISM